jgi:hypothetical protein
VKDFQSGDLTIKLTKVGQTVTLTWLGQSSMRDPATELTPYLQQVIEAAKGHELVVAYVRTAKTSPTGNCKDITDTARMITART